MIARSSPPSNIATSDVVARSTSTTATACVARLAHQPRRQRDRDLHASSVRPHRPRVERTAVNFDAHPPSDVNAALAPLPASRLSLPSSRDPLSFPHGANRGLNRGLRHAGRRAAPQLLAPPRRYLPRAAARRHPPRRPHVALHRALGRLARRRAHHLRRQRARHQHPLRALAPARHDGPDRRSSRSTSPSSAPPCSPPSAAAFDDAENNDVLALGLARSRALDDGRLPQRRLGQPVLPLRAHRTPHPRLLPHVPRRPHPRRRVHGRLRLRPRDLRRRHPRRLEGHQPQRLHRRHGHAPPRRARPELPRHASCASWRRRGRTPSRRSATASCSTASRAPSSKAADRPAEVAPERRRLARSKRRASTALLLLVQRPRARR